MIAPFCSKFLLNTMLEFYCLTAQQKRTLRLRSELSDRAVSENSVFAHYVLSLSDQQKASDLLGD